MTLRIFRVPRFSRSPLTAERSQIRSLFRKASQGNVHAYVQATASYTNLIAEYLFLCGLTQKTELVFELKQILTDCWRYLPYTRRVSDFERFLQVRLERIEVRSNSSFPAPHEALSKLSHQGRFLLVARVLNDWSIKSIRLALRSSKKEISESLMQLRCKLTGINSKKLSPSEKAQVLRVSELLEGEYSDKICRKIERELSEQYHALQFKADWLSYRCELADLRLEMGLTTEERTELAESVTEQIRQQPMEKPRLYDSLVNQISFVRLPLL